MDKSNPKFDDLPEAVAEILTRLERIEEQIKDLPKQVEEREEVFTVHGVANYLNLSKTTIYTLVSRREIPHYKTRGRLFFSKEAIMDWLKVNPRDDKYNGDLSAIEKMQKARQKKK